jgi:hypothetical protein
MNFANSIDVLAAPLTSITARHVKFTVGIVLYLLIESAGAQQQSDPKRDELDVTMQVIQDPAAKLPDEVVRRIPLPERKQNTPPDPKAGNKPEKPDAAAEDKERARDAKDAGREMGQSAKDRAKEAAEQREQARRSEAEDRRRNPRPPPDPPGRPPGRPPGH